MKEKLRPCCVENCPIAAEPNSGRCSLHNILPNAPKVPVDPDTTSDLGWEVEGIEDKGPGDVLFVRRGHPDTPVDWKPNGVKKLADD